jgi:hypothetical protein
MTCDFIIMKLRDNLYIGREVLLQVWWYGTGFETCEGLKCPRDQIFDVIEKHFEHVNEEKALH